MVTRVEKSKEKHISASVSDRWLCYRTTRLCPEDDVPELDADEEEDDAEL